MSTETLRSGSAKMTFPARKDTIWYLPQSETQKPETTTGAGQIFHLPPEEIVVGAQGYSPKELRDEAVGTIITHDLIRDREETRDEIKRVYEALEEREKRREEAEITRQQTERAKIIGIAISCFIMGFSWGKDIIESLP